MTQDQEGFEAIRQPENLANRVGGMLVEVDDYNRKHLPDMFVNVVQDGLRQRAIDSLTDRGIDMETAVANVNAIEGGDPAEVDREFMGMVHDDTLRAAGLKLESTGAVLDVRVVDGLRFADALENPPVGTDGERLAKGLNSFFTAAIHDAKEIGLAVSEEETLGIVGEAMFPNWTPRHESGLNPGRITSFQQIMGAAPALAERLQAAGGNEMLAGNLQSVAKFVQEGNLVPWAFCSEFGLLPETAIGGVHSGNNWWESWDSAEDWEPLARIFDRVAPGSAFHEHLRRSVAHALDYSEVSLQDMLNESFEDYKVGYEASNSVQNEAAKDSVGGGDSDTWYGHMPSDAMLRTMYGESQQYARTQLTAYTTVRQRLSLETPQAS